MKLVVIVIATVLITSFVTTAIIKSLDIKQQVVQQSKKIKVGLKWLNQAQFAGMYIAKDKEFYQKSGLAVELVEKDLNAQPVVDQVINGTLDFGIVSTSSFLKAVDGKKKITALAAMFQYSPTIIVSLQDKQIFEPKDLQGKTLGVVTENEESKLIIQALLAKANVPIDSVSFKSLGIDRTTALLDGSVDAIAIYRTNDLYELLNKGIKYNSIQPERFGVDIYNDILIASNDFINKNPSLIKEFVLTTREGWTYADQNLDEAVQITMKHDNPKYHDEEREKYILTSSLKLMTPKSSKNFGEMSPVQWDYTYNLFFEQNLIGVFDIHHYFTPQYLFN